MLFGCFNIKQLFSNSKNILDPNPDGTWFCFEYLQDNEGSTKVVHKCLLNNDKYFDNATL